MRRILIIFLLNLMILTNSHAQCENLYNANGSLSIDSSFHLSSNGLKIFKENCKCVIPSLYSVTLYPEIQRENGLEGIVIASIIVNSDMTTSNLRIEKSSNEDFSSVVLKSMESNADKIGSHLNSKYGQEKYYFPFVFKLKQDNWDELMKENKGITIESKCIIKQCWILD